MEPTLENTTNAAVEPSGCYKQVKVVVMFSGGKDSHACLIWAVEKYGAKRVTALFCDTDWEHADTYTHIKDTTTSLGVELVTVRSKKYAGMVDLAVKKKRFPSTRARFCTEQLKSIPAIDWVLSQNCNLMIIQGIRKDESASRSKMNEACRYFKFYFEPYGYDKNGKPKFHTYRKKDVLAWCEKYDDSIIRPVFNWSGQEVIDKIISFGHKPNPLYYKGMKRVGCYPCVMANKSEIKHMALLTPEYIERLNQAEIKVDSSFFTVGYIPDRFCSLSDKNGTKYPSISDVVNYVTREKTIDLFEDESDSSCMSFYGICE